MKSETQNTTDAETLPIFLQDFSNVWFVEALYLSLLGSRRDVPAVQDRCRGKGRVSWCTAACAWSSTAAGRGGAPSWASQSMQGEHQAGNKWEGRAGQHLTVPHPLQGKRAMRASGDTSRKEVLSVCIFLGPLSEGEVIKQRLETMIYRFMRYTHARNHMLGTTSISFTSTNIS